MTRSPMATQAALDKPKRVRAKKAVPATETFVAFKGFDSTLACRGHQYEVGKTYVHAGQVVQCSSGFHVCQNPLDVLDFYPLENGNRFARVTVGGKIDRSDDKKWAAAEITVSAELTFPAFVKAAIDWTVAACKASKDGTASSGDYAKNASSGYSATNASSGDYATNASSGDYAKNASSGDSATNASSGDYATNASSGDYAKNASGGDYAKNASSGDYATNASGGDYAKNASSGDYAKNASSGDYAKNASSGDSATNEATGKHAVIASAGRNSRAKGATGAWISLAEYDGLICIGFATGCAGKGGVPADTWLIAKGGKLVAA
jgi:hypothetical protein